MSDWLKPATVPSGAASDEPFATNDDDEVLRDEMQPPPVPGATRSGQATGAAGGYGTASGRASSGGSGEGTDETSNAGDDDQTEWLRDAPGGGDAR